jgi:hypothetical protein
VKKSNDQVTAAVVRLLKANKNLTEREVKAAVVRELGLGSKPMNPRVIRDVRRSLGIDRPRALAWARQLLAKNPRLEAKKVITDLSERFGIRLSPPDVTRLRPDRAQQPRTEKAKPRVKTGKASRAAHTVTVFHHAEGNPTAVARFFRSLAE